MANQKQSLKPQKQLPQPLDFSQMLEVKGGNGGTPPPPPTTTSIVIEDIIND